MSRAGGIKGDGGYGETDEVRSKARCMMAFVRPRFGASERRWVRSSPMSKCGVIVRWRAARMSGVGSWTMLFTGYVNNTGA